MMQYSMLKVIYQIRKSGGRLLTDIEIFDMPTTPIMKVEEPTPQPKEEEIPAPDLNPNNKFFQPEPPKEEDFTLPTQKEEVVNPMSFVETLDAPANIPTYDGNNASDNNNDISETISEIRNMVSNIQSKGVKIRIDEADLDNSYQINISIDK